jgi:hypothetical protein
MKIFTLESERFRQQASGDQIQQPIGQWLGFLRRKIHPDRGGPALSVNNAWHVHAL